MTPLLGAVLAGGAGRRFGGDKAMALLDGVPLIERVIAALAAQCDAVIVCGRTMAGQVCVPDRPAAGLGPLAGIAAALRHATDHDYRAVLTAPCDTPLLPADLGASLEAIAPAFLGNLPLIGLWPCGLADPLDAHLARDGSRSVRGWAEQAGATVIDRAIVNVNTPGDLAALATGRYGAQRDSRLDLRDREIHRDRCRNHP